MKDIGIYIHIPFCMHKCFYCDFTSFSNADNLIEDYFKALKVEIENKINEKDKNDLVNCNIKTIYIGGGTPSYVDSKYICEIIGLIKEKYNVDKDAEITIEVNPGTVNKEKLDSYFECGINRLSIGLQSTNDNLLKMLGRIHNYQEFLDTYNLARKVGFKNINVDLMIGLPKQKIEDVEESLEKIISLDPEHISVYSLILEENTVFEEKVNNNELELPEEELERKMYWRVKSILEENEYIHYEISNFAKEGFYSKHNMDCWNQKEYIGFGVAAHSYAENKRYSNTDNLKKYILYFKDKENDKNIELGNIRTIHEIQNKESQMKEYMLLGLRKIEGVKISEFKNKFVDNPIYVFKDSLNKLVNEELIEIDIDEIKLTNKGIDLANIVWEEFI